MNLKLKQKRFWHVFKNKKGDNQATDAFYRHVWIRARGNARHYYFHGGNI